MIRNNRVFVHLSISIGVSILIYSVLAVLFWSFISDTILVPIYYLVWVGGLLINSVSQGKYLTLLVLLSIVIGGQTLISLYTLQHREHEIYHQPHSRSRYIHWHELCMSASGTWLAKGLLASEVHDLILSILAVEYSMDPTEVKEMVLNGLIPIAEPLRQVIKTKSIPDVARRRSFWRHRQEMDVDPHVEQLLAALVRFLEQHLEITPHA